MARTRAGQAAAEAFGKVGTVKVPRDANGVEAAADTPAAAPAPQRPAQRRMGARKPKAVPESAATPPPVPEIDDPALLATWRWTLGAKALKAAATRTKAEAAMAGWQRVVADAERAGVPARLVVAAAAGANLDM